MAAVSFDDLTSESQAHTSSLFVVVLRIETFENAENVFLEFISNAYAVVFHVKDLQFSASFSFGSPAEPMGALGAD